MKMDDADDGEEDGEEVEEDDSDVRILQPLQISVLTARRVTFSLS